MCCAADESAFFETVFAPNVTSGELGGLPSAVADICARAERWLLRRPLAADDGSVFARFSVVGFSGVIKSMTSGLKRLVRGMSSASEESMLREREREGCCWVEA